jgi:PAS domain S-box-containing protein
VKRASLPLRARSIILGLVVLGVAAIVVRVPSILRWSSRDALACLALVGAVSLMEQFPLKVKYRTETWNFSLTDAVCAAGLLLVPAGVLTVAVGGGILLGHLIRRVNPYKIAFNVGQFLVSIWIAEAVFGLLPHGGSGAPATWAAVAPAMLAFFVVNASSVAVIISVVEDKSFLSVLLPPLGLNVIHFAGNLAIGIVGAVLWTVRPVAVPLLVVPLVLSYFAYRAWVHGMRERDTMHHLYEAGRSLMHPLAGEDDYREFLGHLQQMLLAAAAEIVVVENGKVTLHDAEGSLTLTADAGEDGEARHPEAFVRAHPGLTTHTAVTSDTDGVHAVLAIHREETLSSSERSLLEALASQFSVRLENARLFAETLEQRRQLEEIIAHTSNGIFVVDPDGSIVSWNHAMERMTGFSSSEAVGQPCAEILGSDWLLDGDVAGPRAGSLDGGAEGRDVQLVTKDRVGRWIRYTANRIVDHDGRTTASVVVARDVTVSSRRSSSRRISWPRSPTSFGPRSRR